MWKSLLLGIRKMGPKRCEYAYLACYDWARVSNEVGSRQCIDNMVPETVTLCVPFLAASVNLYDVPSLESPLQTSAAFILPFFSYYQAILIGVYLGAFACKAGRRSILEFVASSSYHSYGPFSTAISIIHPAQSGKGAGATYHTIDVYHSFPWGGMRCMKTNKGTKKSFRADNTSRDR